MKILTLDVETTTSNKGHWADKKNKLVMLGLKWLDEDPFTIYLPHHSEEEARILAQYPLQTADIIVGFNIKFDLHWLANIGVDIRCMKRIWDCQIAEFLLSAQRNPYNSLNDACIKYNIPLKLDVVKTEYWDKGIDTTGIPMPVLQAYLEADLDRTERVFKIQYELFTGEKL